MLVLTFLCVVLKMPKGFGIPMLSSCWEHTDGIETSGECRVEDVFKGQPHFHRECIPIIKFFGKKMLA